MSVECFDSVVSQSRQSNLNSSKKVWWVNGVFVLFVHVVVLLSPLIYPWRYVPAATWWLTYASWQLATLGITMGYHRLWSHHAYKATFPLRIVLAWMGTLGFQGSIRWWVMRHRLHHRFTDTDQDPYNAKRGFWFSHMGWIFNKPIYTKMSLIDAQDLKDDPVVEFQHRYYVVLALFNGLLLPALIASLWGDFWGGFLYAGYLGRVLIWHVTFCINSFAHLLGEQKYSSETTAKGGFLIALVTNGEGYHNFVRSNPFLFHDITSLQHHLFPRDYRNGHRFYHWDPTKWLIYLLSFFKLGAYGLQKTDPIRIQECLLVQSRKRINDELAALFPESTEEYQCMTHDEIAEQVKVHGKKWIVIDGFVLDLEKEPFPLWHHHPGGQSILKTYLGKDATKMFNGGLNQHSVAARLWMSHLRIGRTEELAAPSKGLKLE